MAGGLVVAAACAVDVDRIDLSYPTFDEAVAASAAGNLWIPPVLPRSATEIVATYDVDAGETWIRFRHAADLASVLQSLEKVQTPAVFPRSRRVSWWPPELSKEAGRATRYEFYRCPRHSETAGGRRFTAEAYLAVDGARGIVYYWQLGRVRVESEAR